MKLISSMGLVAAAAVAVFGFSAGVATSNSADSVRITGVVQDNRDM